MRWKKNSTIKSTLENFLNNSSKSANCHIIPRSCITMKIFSHSRNWPRRINTREIVIFLLQFRLYCLLYKLFRIPGVGVIAFGAKTPPAHLNRRTKLFQDSTSSVTEIFRLRLPQLPLLFGGGCGDCKYLPTSRDGIANKFAGRRIPTLLRDEFSASPM